MKFLEKLRPKWKLHTVEDGPSEASLEQLAEQQMAAETMERETQQMQVLVNLPAWDMVDDYINKQIEVWRTKLEKKDDPDIRANIKAYRSLKTFVLSKIKRI